jgi:hypothetical protein
MADLGALVGEQVLARALVKAAGELVLAIYRGRDK